MVAQAGIWLGGLGRDLRHVFVPIVTGHEQEPDPEAWGIKPSRSNRPKIVANYDSSPGLLLMLTSFNGPGNAQGKVLVNEMDMEQVFVVGWGIGGDNTGVRYDDYLVQVDGPCRFYVQRTVAPDLLLSYDGEEVMTQEITNSLDGDELFLPLDDPRVRKWQRALTPEA